MLVIVQARLNSKRLPGKILKKINGKPMLAWVLNRLSNCKFVTKIVVGTSKEKSDDPIFYYCNDNGYLCYRGCLNNVVERFATIIQQEQIPAFVRISGDSPLIDPKIVDQAIQLYENIDSDLVTNILIRSFPKGQSVEVLRSETFLKIQSEFDGNDQEHVTPYYYRHPHKFKIISFTSGVDAGGTQLSVDTIADFQKIEQLLKKSSGYPKGWKELWEMSKKFEN